MGGDGKWEGGKGGGKRRGRRHAFKVLCPDILITSIMGPRGTTKGQIEEETGCKLIFSNREEFYPGTQFRTLCVYADEPDLIMGVLDKIVDHVGYCGEQEQPNPPVKAEGDFVCKEPGTFIVRAAISVRMSGAVIGPKGATVQAIREESSAKVFIEKNIFQSHQMLKVLASPEGLRTALLRINECVQSESGTDDFMEWASVKVFSEEASEARPKGREKGKGKGGKGGKGGHRGGCKGEVYGGPHDGGRDRERSPRRGHWDSGGTGDQGEEYAGWADGWTIGSGEPVDGPSAGCAGGVAAIDSGDACGHGGCVGGWGEGCGDGSAADGWSEDYGGEGVGGWGSGGESDACWSAEGAGGDWSGGWGDTHGDAEYGDGSADTPLLNVDPNMLQALGATADEFPDDTLQDEYTITCELPTAKVSALIGKKGENIQTTRKITGTRIHFEEVQGSDSQQTLLIRGPLLRAYRAHSMMMKRYHDAEIEAAKAAENASVKQLQSQLLELQQQLKQVQGQVGIDDGAKSKGKGKSRGKGKGKGKKG